jgi:hypothetical protein
MKRTILVGLLMGGLVGGLLLLMRVSVSGSNASSQDLSKGRVQLAALTDGDGCTAYPIVISATVRSATPPGQGSHPYPDLAKFEYPLAPPDFEHFASHQPDLPLSSASTGTLYRIDRGFDSGGLDWLVWNEGIDASSTTLAHSLAWPGDSDDYVDHGDPGAPLGSFGHVVRGYIEAGDVTDTQMDLGDWVGATEQVTASVALRQALEAHVDAGRLLRLPVGDVSDPGAGANGRYAIGGFALFRLVGFNLTQAWVVLEFLAWDNACATQLAWKQYLPLVRWPGFPPRILYFTANVELADPGDTIELAWETAHATSVTLYHLLPTGQFGSFWPVSVSGTMTYTISESRRNQDGWMLYADNEAYPADSAMLSVPLNCPFAWFFAPAPDICAQDAAIISLGAEQRFEHGLMLWVGAEDRIYTLYDPDPYTARWDAFSDDWQEGDPVDDPTIIPPPGFYQPQRGFGLVWREQFLVRERLGWAVALEQGYETATQSTSYARYNEIYLRAADGNVWWLKAEGSDWEKVFVTGRRR